jgi:hypothetical protein
MRAQRTIPEVTLPTHRFSSLPNLPRTLCVAINNVSIDLIKLDRCKAMIQDLIEADDKNAFDQPANHNGMHGKMVTSLKLRVCLVRLLHDFCQMHKPVSQTACGVAHKSNTCCQAFCFSAILANPDLGKPDEGQAPVPATQTTESTLVFAQPTNQAIMLVTPASQTLTHGALPNQQVTIPQWGYQTTPEGAILKTPPSSQQRDWGPPAMHGQPQNNPSKDITELDEAFMSKLQLTTELLDTKDSQAPFAWYIAPGESPSKAKGRRALMRQFSSVVQFVNRMPSFLRNNPCAIAQSTKLVPTLMHTYPCPLYIPDNDYGEYSDDNICIDYYKGNEDLTAMLPPNDEGDDSTVSTQTAQTLAVKCLMPQAKKILATHKQYLAALCASTPVPGATHTDQVSLRESPSLHQSTAQTPLTTSSPN